MSNSIDLSLHYQALFSENNAVILLINPDSGKIIDASRGACRYYGYSMSDLTAMSSYDINTMSESEITAELQKAKENSKNHFNFSHRLSSGEIRDVEVYSNPISIEDQTFLYSIIHDITEYKQHEKTVLEHESFYQKLLNDMVTFVAILHPNGEIIFVNNTPLKVGGFELKDVIGRKFYDAPWWTHTDEVRNKIMHDIEQCSEGKTLVHDIQIQILDGSLMWIEYSMHPIFDEQGVVKYVIPEGRDINDRKLMEQELEQHRQNLERIVEERTKELNYLNENLEIKVEEEVEKNIHKDMLLLQQSRLAQMGEMISMIAHQWRQPLGAIASTAIDLKIKMELETFDLQTQEGQDACNDYFLGQLNDIEHFVQNLTTTIDDFRNFYKPNKELVSVTLETAIDKALNIIKTSLENDNVEIILDYRSKGAVELYDNEIMQVILNILKNAQDNFREKAINKPQITISTFDKSIEICDNGGGIPETIIEKIFDPYFSTKDEKHGTGLGLYMSKTIVEEHHHGDLTVENRDDGVCFTIELPKK